MSGGPAGRGARVLYLSQTGMTEPLGQSQVLAYLERLSLRGYRFEIVSMEPAGTTDAAMSTVRARTDRAGFQWRALSRTKSHSLARKVYESASLGLEAAVSRARTRPEIIHGRAHFPSAIADVVAAAPPRAKFLFDCRGLLGDQYRDVGHWSDERLEYKMLKAWERRAFRRAEGLVVLTKALERWLDAERLLPRDTPRAVIPCCVDTGRFVPDDEARRRVRDELGLGDRTLAVYSGGLGAWYLEEEMSTFLAHLRRHVPDVALLVLTRSDPARFVSLLAAQGFGAGDVFVRSVAPERMHSMIPAADVGLSLIKASFGVIGTSPTKLAEYLSCGAIGVANCGVGDIAELTAERDGCAIATSLEDDALAEAAAHTAALLARPRDQRVASARDVAVRHFDLEAVGAERYAALYEQMLSA